MATTLVLPRALMTRRQDRLALAAQLVKVAQSYQIEAEVEEIAPPAREVVVAIEAGHMHARISLRAYRRTQGAFIVPWHVPINHVRHGHYLSPAVFSTVNEYHGQKATVALYDALSLVAHLHDVFTAVRADCAFTTTPPRLYLCESAAIARATGEPA